MPRPERPYHKRNEPVGPHQERDHPLYATWAGMLTRCYDESDPAFFNYGGRGIKVCSRWWHFKNFAADMGEKPEVSYSIERLDNDLGYSKENCKWADRSEQAFNRRKFKNNTTGHKGVVEIAGRYEARFDYGGVRYRLGRFATLELAAACRNKAEVEFKLSGVLPELAETVWCTSTTKHRGITPHKDGGYTVRKTVNGKRIYLGYYKTLDEAIDAKRATD